MNTSFSFILKTFEICFKTNRQIKSEWPWQNSGSANGLGYSPKVKNRVGEWPWPFFMFENSDTYVSFKGWISTLTRNSLKFYLGFNSRYYSDSNYILSCVPSPKIHPCPNITLRVWSTIWNWVFFIIHIHLTEPTG